MYTGSIKNVNFVLQQWWMSTDSSARSCHHLTLNQGPYLLLKSSYTSQNYLLNFKVAATLWLTVYTVTK